MTVTNVWHIKAIQRKLRVQLARLVSCEDKDIKSIVFRKTDIAETEQDLEFVEDLLAILEQESWRRIA